MRRVGICHLGRGGEGGMATRVMTMMYSCCRDVLVDCGVL